MHCLPPRSRSAAAHASLRAVMASSAAPRAPPCTPPAAQAVPLPDFHLLLEYSDNVFCILDMDGTALYASPNAARVFDAAPDALVGRSMLVGVHPEERSHLAAMLHAVRDAPPNTLPALAHLRALRRAPLSAGENLAWVWAEIKLSSDGQFVYLVAREVTAEKKREEMLRCFLLSTSHELRTPVHGMSCASELLVARASIAADSETAYLLRVVRASCRLMLCTITNVLDLKTIEAAADGGRTHRLLRCEPLDVCALLADVLDVCRVGCTARIEQLQAALPPNVPTVLEGDADRLHQVFLNVAVVCLRNAATGAAPGTTTVALSRCDAGACPAGAMDVSVCFVAAGRVLSPAEIGAAFEPYSSHDGLALKVARFFAHAMCGDLCLVLGDGCTRFELRVRLHVPGGPPPEPCDTPPPRAVAATAAQASAASTAPPPVGVALTQQMLEHLMRYSDELFHSGDFRPDGALFDFVSPSVEQYGLGLTCADFVGQDAADKCHPDDLARWHATFSDAVARSNAAGGAATPISITRRIKFPHNKWFTVHTSGCVVGTHWHLVCKMLREQEAKEQGMRNLLLSISHELREPVQSSLAASQLLAQHANVVQDSEAAFLVQAICASCGFLLGMVSNAQSMRSIEDGTLDMHVTPFDARATVRDLLQVCRLGCAQSNISWANEAEPLPVLVEADRSFFCQILQNLVTNATRFQDERGVTVRVSCAVGGGGAATPGFLQVPTHTLEVAVADRGCGLSPHDCARIFEAYEAASPAHGGQSGLGLFISRTCARRAGGDLFVASTPGQGATFTLRFPVYVPAAAAVEWEAAAQAWRQGAAGAAEVPCWAHATPGLPPPAAAAAAAGSECAASPRVSGGAHELPSAGTEPAGATRRAAPPPRLRCLLVDDHALNLKLVKLVLEKHGFTVETGANGREAFDKLRVAFETGAPPSIAIIDMQMPGWSGPDAARAWRTWEAQHRQGRPRLPMLCLTANVMEENREECEAAGFDAFLPKPLRATALMELRERAAAYAQQLAAAPVAAAVPEAETR